MVIAKPKTAVEKRTRTTVDTIMITPEALAKWKTPSGQRPLRVNAKVLAIAEQIKEDGGVIPGILTLGVWDGHTWIIDGQHRLQAFLLAELKEGYADVRFLYADSMADINREFVELNSKLVNMRPDDFLRGLEGTIPALSQIRAACKFVGYDQIKRDSPNGATISMASVLRWWRGSAMETPAGSSGGSGSAVDLAQNITADDTHRLIEYLNIAGRAFGREMQYCRLWGSLNTVLCMWCFRRLVLQQWSAKVPQLTPVLFEKCLLSLSADATYLDWLLGRQMGERDRGPAYARVKAIFGKRLETELGRKVQLPQPDWAT